MDIIDNIATTTFKGLIGLFIGVAFIWLLDKLSDKIK